MIELWYIGIRRDGTELTGSDHCWTAAELTQRLYSSGVRSLVVTDAAGNVVGDIKTVADGQRVWWADDVVGGRRPRQ